MAGMAANLCIFGALFISPEKVTKIFPMKDIKLSTENKVVFMPIDEEKSKDDDEDFFSRTSSSAPLKSDDSSSTSSSELLPLSEYIYLWADKRFLILAARLETKVIRIKHEFLYKNKLVLFFRISTIYFLESHLNADFSNFSTSNSFFFETNVQNKAVFST
jgi:hypothetical protein